MKIEPVTSDLNTCNDDIDIGRQENLPYYEMSLRKRIFFIAILPISSILYGIVLKTFTLENTLSKKYSTNISDELYEVLVPLGSTMAILGAALTNFLLIFVKNTNIPRLMTSSSLLHTFGYLTIILHPHILVILFAKFVIGMGSGIAFAFITKILNLLAYEKYLSITLSLHPLAITMGLMIGTSFDFLIDMVDYKVIHGILALISTVNAISLFFLPKVSNDENNTKNTSLKKLILKKEVRTFLITTVIFHLGQHLSGVDYFSVFTSKIFQHQGNGTLMAILSLGVSCIFTLFANFILGYLGEGIMMLLSCLIVAISTTLISSLEFHVIFVILFIFGFNLGLSFIPWGYAASKFSLQDQNASNNVGVTVNMLASFIMANICFFLQEYIGQSSFLVYTVLMLILAVFSGFVYKEDIFETCNKFKDTIFSIKCFKLSN